MSVSGNFTTSNQYIVYWLEMIQNSQNIPANTSNVTILLWCKRTNTGYTTQGTGTAYIYLDGVPTGDGITSAETITSTPRCLCAITRDITHNPDGTRTIDLAGRIDHSQFNSSPQIQSWNGRPLTTIPRASLITAFNNFTLGLSDINLAVSTLSYSNTFNLDFALKVNGSVVETWTNITANGGNQNHSLELSAAVQDSILALIPSAVSTTVVLECQTQSGATNIGSVVSAGATATVDSGIVPTIGTINHSELTTNPAVATLVGKYVQKISSIRLAISSYAGAKYSTIASVIISYRGSNYAANTLDTGAIDWSGNLDVTAQVTDSRGRTASVTVTINALAYNFPSIISAEIQRCLSGGTLAALGTYAKLTKSLAVQSLINGTEKNTLQYTVESRPRGGTWATKYTSTPSSTLTDVTSNILGTADEYVISLSYEFRITVVDIMNSTLTLLLLPTSDVPGSWSRSGLSAGKIWERGAMDVGLEGLFVDGDFRTYQDAQVDGDALIAGEMQSASGAITGDMSTRGFIIPKEQGAYNQTNGVIMTLFPIASLGKMVTVEITGNAYGNRKPIKTILQGYYYDPPTSQYWLSVSQLNLGGYMPPAKFFTDGGYAKIWFKQNALYQTLVVKAYGQDGAVYNDFSLVGGAEPTGTNKVTATMTDKKVIYADRTCNLSGTQNIEVGFRPKNVKITAVNSMSTGLQPFGAYRSYGACDSYGGQVCIYTLGDNSNAYNSNEYIVHLHSGGAINRATITFYDTGFTLTWDLINAIHAGIIRMLIEVD